jgi:hypothetical protein
MGTDTCRRRLAELTAQANQLYTRRSHLTTEIDSPPTAPPAADLSLVREHIQDVITAGTPHNHKTLYGALIERIDVTPDGTLIPVYRIPAGTSEKVTESALTCENTGQNTVVRTLGTRAPPTGLEPVTCRLPILVSGHHRLPPDNPADLGGWRSVAPVSPWRDWLLPVHTWAMAGSRLVVLVAATASVSVRCDEVRSGRNRRSAALWGLVWSCLVAAAAVLLCCTGSFVLRGSVARASGCVMCRQLGLSLRASPVGWPRVRRPCRWQDTDMADDDSRAAPRKRLRVGHISERGGVNAVRTLLEAHGLVVDEVEGRSDYGRDLIVDLIEDNEITGAVIGVQVKGDRRFLKEGIWELPTTDKDLRYWAESSVPVVGILWNPDNGEMRWTNLTAFARTDPTISTWPPGPPHKSSSAARAVQFDESHRLDDSALPHMIEQMYRFVQQSGAPALLNLFEADDDRRCRAIYDCWVLGRTDARAFLLLRYALKSLEGNSLREAIITLSYLTPHPDIFWHSGNWVPPEVERRARVSFRWTPQEIVDLVQAVERFTDGDGWQRGGLGQSLWSILVVDPNLHSTLPYAIEVAARIGSADIGMRLLIMLQYLADDPLAAATAELEKHPFLREHESTAELMEIIERYGHIDVY